MQGLLRGFQTGSKWPSLSLTAITRLAGQGKQRHTLGIPTAYTVLFLQNPIYLEPNCPEGLAFLVILNEKTQSVHSGKGK